MNRITATTGSRLTLANIQSTARTLNMAQERISSGKQVRKPSDGPAQVLSALDYRAQIRRSQQLERNILDARSWLDSADSALTHSVDQLTRAKTLVLGGLNASTDAQGRLAYAAELETIAEGLVETANTQYLGRPIFAGTSGAATAYDAAGLYQGNAGTVQRSIAAAVEIQVNRPGPHVFGDQDGTDAASLDGNVFQVVRAVAQALRDGDMVAAQAGLDRLDGAVDRISATQVELGARAKQVEEVGMRNQQVGIDLKFSLAEVEDTDIVEAIINLQAQEMAYQGALSVAARIIQPTLLDFLR
ncbi:MAG: flagellin N-terminal helical domain-containing protein [Acidimicrobiales bacterium]